MAMLWTRGVETGRLTPEEFVAVTSTNIAKILNIYPLKGGINVGGDADVVVWDPTISKTVAVSTQKSIIDYNVFEGMEVTAQARYTVSRGEVIWACGQNSASRKPGRGPLRPPVSGLRQCQRMRRCARWKALTARRGMIQRDPLNIPAGV